MVKIRKYLGTDWFIILYITGSIIKRMNENHCLPSKRKSIFGYLIATGLLVFIAFIQSITPISRGRDLMWDYSNPIIYFSSISLFVFFITPPPRWVRAKLSIGLLNQPLQSCYYTCHSFQNTIPFAK